MSGVFQNIDPPPPHRPASVYPPPPPLVRGEDTLSLLERGEGGQYFGRRQTLLCTLCKYFVFILYIFNLKRDGKASTLITAYIIK
jgi:hypothetical protein